MDLIKRTFQHIKGINPKKEKLLWEEGVFDWQDAIEKIDAKKHKRIFKRRIARIDI